MYSTDDLNGLNTVWAQEGADIIGNVNVKHIVTRECDGNISNRGWKNAEFWGEYDMLGLMQQLGMEHSNK